MPRDQDELIDELSGVLRTLAELEPYKERLVEELIALSDAKVGDILVSSNGNKLRLCDRAKLDEEKLERAVSKGVWNRITVRKPVAAKIRLAVQQGIVSKAVVDRCYGRSRKWFERR